MNRPLCTQAVAVAKNVLFTRFFVCFTFFLYLFGKQSGKFQKIQRFSPPRKNCQGISLAGSGARSAPLPARRMPWQFLRGGENCCHGDRLGTQAWVQLADTTIDEKDRRTWAKMAREDPVFRNGRFDNCFSKRHRIFGVISTTITLSAQHTVLYEKNPAGKF